MRYVFPKSSPEVKTSSLDSCYESCPCQHSWILLFLRSFLSSLFIHAGLWPLFLGFLHISHLCVLRRLSLISCSVHCPAELPPMGSYLQLIYTVWHKGCCSVVIIRDFKEKFSSFLQCVSRAWSSPIVLDLTSVIWAKDLIPSNRNTEVSGPEDVKIPTRI